MHFQFSELAIYDMKVNTKMKLRLMILVLIDNLDHLILDLAYCFKRSVS